jgi:hypothetical protein
MECVTVYANRYSSEFFVVPKSLSIRTLVVHPANRSSPAIDGIAGVSEGVMGIDRSRVTPSVGRLCPASVIFIENTTGKMCGERC